MFSFIGFAQLTPFKNKLSITIAFITFAALSFMAPSTHAAKALYKWQDEEGTVHYSERPPAGVTEFEKVVSEYSPGNSVTNTEVNAETEPETNTSLKPERQQQPQGNTASKERCDKARKNLEALNSFARIRIQDESGDMRFLNEEEISDRKMETQAILQDECGGY